MEVLRDENYMRLALQAAAGAEGQTGSNPVVGCVVVKDGRMLGIGAHLGEGTPHAEVHALNMAGGAAEGSTVYVTLEPCNHYGRTPPCCDRLIAAKVSKVVVACEDPNPLVAGSGIARLRANGIAVEVGLLRKEALQLNDFYRSYIVHKRPFVAVKVASTLDGRIASRTGSSQWITNEQSRAYVHTLRHRYQAIMVGVNTVLADNPKLNTRLTVPALDPVVIVMDSQLRTPLDAAIWQTGARVMIIATEQADHERRAALSAQGAEVIDAGSGERVDLRLAMQLLGERGIASILLEGGGRLNGAMLAEQLIDKCYLFYAAKIIGGKDAVSNFAWEGFERMEEAISLQQVEVHAWGDNWCVTGYPNYESMGKQRALSQSEL